MEKFSGEFDDGFSMFFFYFRDQSHVFIRDRVENYRGRVRRIRWRNFCFWMCTSIPAKGVEIFCSARSAAWKYSNAMVTARISDSILLRSARLLGPVIKATFSALSRACKLSMCSRTVWSMMGYEVRARARQMGQKQRKPPMSRHAPSSHLDIDPTLAVAWEAFD